MAREDEYLTSNRKIRYPFADDTTLIHDTESGRKELSGDMNLPVFGCFVDAFVQIVNPYNNAIPAITGIKVAANTIHFTLIDKTTPEYGRVSLKCTRTADRFPIIKGKTDWCWYTFVMSSDGIREYSEKCETIGNIDFNVITFNDRCVGQSSTGVSSLWIYGGKKKNRHTGRRLTRVEALLDGPDEILTDSNITIRPGYNMIISPDADENGIKYDVKIGAGLGIAPCEDEPTCITYKTPGLLSKDGHTRMFNDTCYDVLADRVDSKHGYLYMHVKCKACCTCGMYESIVNDKLIPLRNTILATRESILNTYDKYEDTVKKWNTRIKTATREDIVTTLSAVALDAAATNIESIKVRGRMNRCGFSLLMRNDSFVPVTFNLESFIASGSTFESQISYMQDSKTPAILPVDLEAQNESGSDPLPIFTVNLSAGHSAVLTYFVRKDDMVGTDIQTGFMSILVISAYQEDRLIDRRIERLYV